MPVILGGVEAQKEGEIDSPFDSPFLVSVGGDAMENVANSGHAEALLSALRVS